jgi:fructose-bisphosphate aldolase, class I
MVAEGKGILAADESSPTIGKRFAKLGIDQTVDQRQAYRDMLFTTKGLEESISGVILYDETIRQTALDGTPFPKLLADRGIIPGIKVDTGAKDLAFAPGEKITEGLDGLRDRLKEYWGLGARFAKWRAVITIGDGIPSDHCINANAHALARYAALCQEADIVPIVEPEVLMDADNTIERCLEVTEKTLKIVFSELYYQRVAYDGMVLKPNMVISGMRCPEQASPREVAEKTLEVLKNIVPASVAGIAFLSGGQSDAAASEHLNIMNQIGGVPWPLSFSYGRALQMAALQTWGGSRENVSPGQEGRARRANANSAATDGKYSADMEKAGV